MRRFLRVVVPAKTLPPFQLCAVAFSTEALFSLVFFLKRYASLLKHGVIAWLFVSLPIQLLAASPPSLQVAVSATPLSTPFFIADAQGYFAKQGLDISLVPVNGGHRAMAALLEGRADMATSSDIVIMNAARNQEQFCVVGTFVASAKDLQLISRLDSHALDTSQLTGKRIGVTLGTASQYFIDTHLLLAGVDKSQTHYVQIQPEKMSAALYSGEVEAISTWQPWTDQAITQLGNKAVVLGDIRIYTLTFNLIVNPGLEQQPDVIKRILLALIEAEGFIKNNPDTTQAIVAERLKISPQTIRRIWSGYDFRLRLDQSLIITLESQFEWKNTINKEASPMIDFLDVIKPGPLQAIDPKRVTMVR